ncbi:MAG: hypothetical protein K1Y36_10455 [Blastocatellia bacterium]|nr:hypothetical protein [Blastocatellia bacterium]
MDENTKALVASNLTLAFYQGRQPADTENVLAVYREFLESLTEPTQLATVEDGPSIYGGGLAK